PAGGAPVDTAGSVDAGFDPIPVTDWATPAISVATDLPADATSLTTPAALLITFIVPAMNPADALPALNVSSTPSANRLIGLPDGAITGAYLDSRKSM